LDLSKGELNGTIAEMLNAAVSRLLLLILSRKQMLDVP
jgi:hypothetical protein